MNLPVLGAFFLPPPNVGKTLGLPSPPLFLREGCCDSGVFFFSPSPFSPSRGSRWKESRFFFFFFPDFSPLSPQCALPGRKEEAVFFLALFFSSVGALLEEQHKTA